MTERRAKWPAFVIAGPRIHSPLVHSRRALGKRSESNTNWLEPGRTGPIVRTLRCSV